MEPVIVIHGGAGDVPDSGVPSRLAGVKAAAEAGSAVLIQGGSAMDAVVTAVKTMESNPVFNAGTGGVLTLNGEVEADAIVMDGNGLKAGAVGSLKYIEHPIEVARLVMERSPHVLLVGPGALEFAKEQAVPTVPGYRLVTQQAIDSLEAFLNGKLDQYNSETGVGTVGAVAIDRSGHLAMATSTGGITGKHPGRIGDTPLLGSGGYADDEVGAVSATGTGEDIMRVCLSQRIMSNMRSGMNPSTATKEALDYMSSHVAGTAGVIALSKTGEIGIRFISKRMSWAYRQGNGEIISGIDGFPT